MSRECGELGFSSTLVQSKQKWMFFSERSIGFAVVISDRASFDLA